MFNFGKFKTSFNVYSGKLKGRKQEDGIYESSIAGAYRASRNEFDFDNNYSAPQGKPTQKPQVPIAIPSQQPEPLRKNKRAPEPPKMPPQLQPGPLRQSKSTSDLIRENNLPPTLRDAQSNVSLDPRGANEARRNSRGVTTEPVNKRQLDAHKRVEKKKLEEQNKLEKKRLDEQKKREKLELQEQAKQDKLRKDMGKKEGQMKTKKNKRPAPERPIAYPLAQSSQETSNTTNTNTINSSISKTSGPPPYSESVSQNKMENGNQSNVEYSKPIDTGSWDLVSQHRNKVNKPVKATQPRKGQTTLDLNYTLGEDKSEA